MKNLNQSTDATYFDTEKGIWYVLMPSAYSGSAYMIKRLSWDGEQHTVLTGTGAEALAYIASLKQANVVASI